MPGVFGFIWVAFVFIIVFSTIRKANKEVSKSKGKYSNISGAKNLCSNCGKYVSANAYTCPHCGAALKKKCKNCGQWVNVRSQYCTACNAPLDNSATAADNTQCTYHDTYSSGYDPHCHNPHDDLSRYTRRRSIDDIGLVKGKGRNKVETVEEYEKSRHRDGAYHINVNDVNSNYETTTPEQYSSKSKVTVRDSDGKSTAKTQYTSKNYKGKKSGNPLGVLVVVIMIISVIFMKVITNIEFDGNNDVSSTNNSYYATYYLENLSEHEFETDETIKYYYDNYIKNTSLTLTDGEDANFIVYYNNVENNTVDCVLFRVTKEERSLKSYYYYNDTQDRFFIDRYENDIDVDICNEVENGSENVYIQVDYVEFDRHADETMKDNISIRKNTEFCAFSYAEASEPFTITLSATVD